jgi:hypothetical protein
MPFPRQGCSLTFIGWSPLPAAIASFAALSMPWIRPPWFQLPPMDELTSERPKPAGLGCPCPESK